MYIWFDNKGTPSEAITTLVARVGNVGVNSFYVYFDEPIEGMGNIKVATFVVQWADGTKTENLAMEKQDFVFRKDYTSLGRDTDTKNFVDGSTYSGYYGTLDNMISVNGPALMTITATDDSDPAKSIVGSFRFDVEDSVISGTVEDRTQYQELVNLIAQLPFPSPQIIDGNPTDEGINIVAKPGLVVINQNTWEVFEYENGEWTSHGKIKGPDGAQGAKGDTGYSVWKTGESEIQPQSTYSLSVLSLSTDRIPVAGDSVIGTNGYLCAIVSVDSNESTFTTGGYYTNLKGSAGTIPVFYIDSATGNLMVQQSENPTFSLDDTGHLVAHYN